MHSQHKCVVCQTEYEPFMSFGRMPTANGLLLFSCTSVRMTQHFEESAEHPQWDYLDSIDPFIVEIGSNDGITLQHFPRKETSCLGIESCSNVAQLAIDRRVRAVCRFFDEELAKEIVKDYAKVDAFLAVSVRCRILYIHLVVTGIKILLRPDGIVMFEDPYFRDFIEKNILRPNLL